VVGRWLFSAYGAHSLIKISENQASRKKSTLLDEYFSIN